MAAAAVKKLYGRLGIITEDVANAAAQAAGAGGGGGGGAGVDEPPASQLPRSA